MSGHVQISRHVHIYPDISRQSTHSFRGAVAWWCPRHLMVECVICLGASGKPLSGKRCTSSRCKTEYSARLKAARVGARGAASEAGSSPTVTTVGGAATRAACTLPGGASPVMRASAAQQPTPCPALRLACARSRLASAL
eukprot:3571002-Prymnesium_polylepis.1